MNIWEVVCVADLVKILKNSPQQFIIVGIVLETTPKDIQVKIKKFLKAKSQHFVNMKFLFFKANQTDLGKISLLDKDESQYPYIYHIFDTSNIFIKVNCANEQTMIEAFNAGETYYKQNLLEYISTKTPAAKPTQTKSTDTKLNQTKLNQTKLNQTKLNQTDHNNDEWSRQQKEMEIQQKTIEKIITLQQREKDFNLELLKDIQQRKLEESKMKKK